MRIVKFKGEKIHGYMDFNIKFHSDLSFLTGINGSGKTTIIHCLYGLINPSMRLLSSISFELIEVTLLVESHKRQVRIKAIRSDNEINISTNMTKEMLIIPNINKALPPGRPRTSEEQNDFFNDLYSRNANNEVLRYIREELPSPMFLGIERRTIEEDYTSQRYPSVSSRRRLRTTYPGYYPRPSIIEAAELVRDSYSEIRNRIMKLMETLRTQLVLSSLKYEDALQTDFKQIQEFMAADINNNIKMIINSADELGIPKDTIAKELNLFRQNVAVGISNLQNELRDEKKLENIFKKQDQEKISSFMSLFVNIPYFHRINTMYQHIQKYINANQKAYEPIEQYLNIVNSFLKDSHKKINFDNLGNIEVIVNNRQRIPITSLSSGEIQILIMISHLSFNPDARTANVIIIDEPELSLHVAWQELFVESLQAANPKLQMILATHSPSIILDRIENCIELGAV